MKKIGVIGAGAMGSGIAEVAATAGHSVIIYDNAIGSEDRFQKYLSSSLGKLVEKQKITQQRANEIHQNIIFSNNLDDFKDRDLIIEAIIENIEIKQELFSNLEKVVSNDCVLASNTSSLSITAIGACLENPTRFIGIHFFNPATIMPLVEIIPGVSTEQGLEIKIKTLIDSWKKVTVIAKDTPGFIVNRIARPYYSESIRIFEEGIADMVTIDYALKTLGGFKMGPFELMDFIGNDVNYAVTETVFREFWFDPRYKPSFTQKRLVEAKRLGRKSGRGYYDYSEGAVLSQPIMDEKLHQSIFNRVLAMLVNEAVDAWYLKIASEVDIDLAMTKGVNYPKGLIAWGKEIGLDKCKKAIDDLYHEYHEDRYRASVGFTKL